MAEVCKTVASASRQLLLIRRAVTPFRAAGYHESPRRCGADAVVLVTMKVLEAVGLLNLSLPPTVP